VPAAMDDRGFRAPRAGGQVLSSDKLIPSPPREVIDLTRDPPSVEGDNDDGGDVTTKVSWCRKTRMARYRVRLIPPSLIGRFQVVDELPPAPTVLPGEVTPTHRRRLYHFIDGGPTWSREEIPLEECPTWSPKYRTLEQHSTAPLDNPAVDAPHAGTDSFESSLEIPETPAVRPRGDAA
jgi:hypothetical protein